jgi:hypothetical protein
VVQIGKRLEHSKVTTNTNLTLSLFQLEPFYQIFNK